MPGSGACAVSKAAVTGFIRTPAIELAPDNMAVNAIEPGYIDTPGLSGLRARLGAERISHFIPAKRLGRPEEIAGPMVFLASDESSYITGETIVVDGGRPPSRKSRPADAVSNEGWNLRNLWVLRTGLCQDRLVCRQLWDHCCHSMCFGVEKGPPWRVIGVEKGPLQGWGSRWLAERLGSVGGDAGGGDDRENSASVFH